VTTYYLQATSAFAAGFGISLSPCIYPMIPISVGYLGASATENLNPKIRVLGFFAGQVTAYTALGVAAVLLGEVLGFSAEIPWVQIATGLLLMAFAAASFFERLPAFMTKLGSSGSTAKGNTLFGAFVIGASSAAIASPCASPVVGGVLAAVSQVHERAWGVALMFFFAVGLSSLFLVLGLGLTKAKALPKAGLWMTKVHRASSILLALGGLYFIVKGLRSY